MRQIRPLHDKILGYMIEVMGKERKTLGGIILSAVNKEADILRPRWFEITHVGPEQIDVYPGQFALVKNGRWSRGITLDGSMLEEDKIFLIDGDEILMTSDENPINKEFDWGKDVGKEVV
jgi:co-chaperonin GroES (HSP10)